MGLWTHGMRSAAGNMRGGAALRRAGQGLDSKAKTETVAPKPVVTLVMVTKACARGELDDQLVLLAPAAEGNEGKLGAGRSGRGGMCASSAVSANAGAGAGATTHNSLAEGGGWASAPRQHIGQGDATR